ncbi:hypothetical protein [Lactiplantibacillus paraxiangfangensis]|uniref:hypothetical protein n=1 Tax=Lactiplantibacillus paraxiangfangensis TaxID=3076224 RepID=UPI0030C6DCE5
MASVIIPGVGMIADAGLSGANCLLEHVLTMIIGKIQSEIINFSDWIFALYSRLFSIDECFNLLAQRLVM